jgi:hypothetical protein
VRLDGDGRTPVFTAGRVAAVRIIDPGGDPLIILRWYIDPEHNAYESEPIYDLGDLHEHVDIRLEDVNGVSTPLPHIHQTQKGPTVCIWFRCKSCYDRGDPETTVIDYPEVLTTLGALLERCQTDGVPRTENVRSMAYLVEQ